MSHFLQAFFNWLKSPESQDLSDPKFKVKTFVERSCCELQIRTRFFFSEKLGIQKIDTNLKCYFGWTKSGSLITYSVSMMFSSSQVVHDFVILCL